MRLWHATRALDALLADGWLRPMRMPFAYAFSTKEAAEQYAAEFRYDAVVEVEVEQGKGLVVGRWSPSYANGADVVCLRGPAKVVTRRRDYEVLGDVELPPDLVEQMDRAVEQADRDVAARKGR